MKHRVYTVLLLLISVIAVGSGATMLNLYMQQKAVKEEVSISSYARIDPIYASGERLEDASVEQQAYYARLQDMERIYTARMNEIAKESLAIQQKATEELLSIWDEELNTIYQKLRTSLSSEEFRALRSEERAWIRNRDAAANRAASKETYSNSTQNLAYTRSLLQWTKERVYELTAMYYGE